jgi:hypothetical protein
MIAPGAPDPAKAARDVRIASRRNGTRRCGG